MVKGIKKCWIPTLSTYHLILYHGQCNKLEIKQLLKKKSMIVMKNKGKTASELNYPSAELSLDQRIKNMSIQCFHIWLGQRRACHHI